MPPRRRKKTARHFRGIFADTGGAIYGEPQGLPVAEGYVKDQERVRL